MKKLKSYIFLSIASLSPVFLIGCDGSDNEKQSDKDTSQLSQRVVRGLDIGEITANPAGTPGFPFTLSAGETIEFIPDFVLPDTFIGQVPLGTLTADNTLVLRHAGGSTGNLYFPVSESSFKLLYGTAAGDPATVSTLTEAFIEYSFEHRFTRVGDFIPRIKEIYDSADTPGSLQYVTINAGIISSRNKTIVDAASSTGIATVVYPGGAPSVRRFRQIILNNVTSTNNELAGTNPIITGSYTLTDTWQEIWNEDEGAPYTLLHAHSPTGAHTTDITFTETDSGSFIINLNALTQQP
jgi:hypothetical protein